MRILYVTDRTPETTDGRLVYGHSRCKCISYGAATVSLGDDVQWRDLAQYSSDGQFSKYVMKVTRVEELGRIRSMIDLLATDDEGKVYIKDPELKLEEEALAEKHLTQALAGSPYKDVYLYVHGFGNTFDDSVMRIAGVWHYIGRRGVAIAYSWPSGIGGPFGYLYDRESGEFTVYHLKRTLKIIAACKSVERIHIIAHSRGSDVATTALRELNIEYVAQGLNPQKELKLETFVLAAPDLDRDVFKQRFGAENLIGIAKQFVFYCSSRDFALEVADWLFSSSRLGHIDVATFSTSDRAMLRKVHQVQVVICSVSGYTTSHAYVFTNPAALSDLVLVLRDGDRAGSANGRPLIDKGGLWYLDNSYFAGK